MTQCPDIDDLLALTADGAGDEAARAHVEGCAACCALVALATFRSGGPRSSEQPEACAAFEPAMAALVDGSIASAALAELTGHLARCAACNDLAARLTLFKGELDDVPEPVAPSGSDGVREEERIVEASIGTSETTQLTRRAPANEGGGDAPAWRRALPYGVVVSVSAVAAAAVVLLMVGPRGASERPDAAAMRGAESAPAAAQPGGAYVGDAELRVRELELRLREAEQKAREADLRAREAELRARELEAKVTPSPSGAAKTDAKRPEPKTADPKSDEPRPRDVDAPPVHADASDDKGKGYLTVVCNPYCDEVVDGSRSLGPSPIVHLAVAVGQHRITLKKDGSSKVISVVIVEGQLTAQRISMR